MKYEILKKEISVKLLDEKIKIFSSSFGSPSYIIMNHDTLRSLNFFYNDYIEHESIILDSTTKLYAQYHDIPIALCDNLEWGEIELV